MSSTFVVDGFTYKYTHLTVDESMPMMLRLTKALGPALGAVLGEKEEGAAVGSAVVQLVSSIDPQLVRDASVLFGKNCTYSDDKPGDLRMDKALNTHFQGRLLAYFRWLVECISAEYADFFAAMGLERPRV